MGRKQRQAKDKALSGLRPPLPAKKIADRSSRTGESQEKNPCALQNTAVCPRCAQEREKMPAHQAKIIDATLLALSLLPAHLLHGSEGCGVRSDVKWAYGLVR